MKLRGDTAELRRHAKGDKRINNRKAANRAARKKSHQRRQNDSRGKVIARRDVRYEEDFHLMFKVSVSMLRQTGGPVEHSPIQLCRHLRLPLDIIVLLGQRPR